MPAEEMAELAAVYRAKGFTEREAEVIAERMFRDPEHALDTLVREELGLDPDELGSPVGAAGGSFIAFAVGASIPVLPYVLTAGAALVPSLVLSILALFAVGAGVSLLTGRGRAVLGRPAGPDRRRRGDRDLPRRPGHRGVGRRLGSTSARPSARPWAERRVRRGPAVLDLDAPLASAGRASARAIVHRSRRSGGGSGGSRDGPAAPRPRRFDRRRRGELGGEDRRLGLSLVALDVLVAPRPSIEMAATRAPPTTSPTIRNHHEVRHCRKDRAGQSRAPWLHSAAHDRLDTRPPSRSRSAPSRSTGTASRMPPACSSRTWSWSRMAVATDQNPDYVGNGLIVVGIAALIGGRLYHVIDQCAALHRTTSLKIVLPPYTGLGRLRRDRHRDAGVLLPRSGGGSSTWPWADIIAPGIFVMQALGRWGNFFNQELYGPPTTLPWGIAIDCAHRVVAVHLRPPARDRRISTPLFLYESLSGAARRGVPRLAVVQARGRGCGVGDLCRSCSSGTAIVRFLLESLRIGNWHLEGIATAQIFGAAFVAISDRGPRLSPSDARRRERHRSACRPTTGRMDYADEDRPPTLARGDASGGASPDPEPPDLSAEPAPPPAPRRPPRPLRPEALAAARGGARRGPRWLGPDTRDPGVAAVPRRPRDRPVRAVRALPVPDRDVRPGAPADGRLPPRRRRPSRLDGSVRRHACPAARAALLVPRQRPVDLHVALAGALHPPPRRPAPGVARRRRHRRATSASAKAVVDAGGVFVQMPEGTVNGPPGRLGPFRPGAALIALRLDATIVPLAMAGTEELYLGRRMASRVLPPVRIADLLGPSVGRRPARAGEPRGAGAARARHRGARGADRRRWSRRSTRARSIRRTARGASGAA